jgi:hypothetical protein
MTHQTPPDWICPHGKKWAVGCQECMTQEAIDRMQGSLLNVPQPVVSCGRRIPRARGCP